MFLQQYSGTNMCVRVIHTASTMRLLTKETAWIVSRKVTFLWCLGMDSSYISIFMYSASRIWQLQTDSGLSVSMFSGGNLYRTVNSCHRDHMSKTGTKTPTSFVRHSFLWVWTWVSHMQYEMLWSTAASPAQLLCIFHWVGKFWKHLPDWSPAVRWGAVWLMSN